MRNTAIYSCILVIFQYQTLVYYSGMLIVSDIKDILWRGI